MKIRGWLSILLVTVLAMTVLPSSAWAAITCKSTTGEPAVNYVGGLSTVHINPDVPDGTVLATRSGWFELHRPLTITCQNTPPEGILGVWEVTTGAEVGQNIHATGIAGIGVRAAFATGQFYPTTAIYGRDFYPVNLKYLSLEIIKIGDITGSGTLQGEIVKATVPAADGFQLWSIRLSNPVTISPQKPTCKVATPAVEAFLGNVQLSAFDGVGSSSPARPLSIDLMCGGGHAAGLVQVAATITDAGNPLNRSDRMALSAASSAKGVAIQVLKDGEVLKFGPDSSAVGAINQWSAGHAGNGLFRIPLTARYLQTAAVIEPGTANGRATFTLSYP